MPQGADKNHASANRLATRPATDSGIGFRRLSRDPGAVRAILSRARDVLLPPRCPGCGTGVDADDVMCSRCWPDLRMIGQPMCDTCGAPFAHDQLSVICGACAKEAPPFARARSAVVYDDASRGLVIAFKHADRTEIAGLFVRWLAIAGEDLIDDADLIVPVPLHPRRLFRRRYNQAAILAEGLAKRSGKAVLLDALSRIKPSPPPGKASPAERRRAVAGAFRVTDERRQAIRGKRVLLVDDVMTTGATARAATKQLRRAGARAVDVLTVARAVRE